MMKDLRFAILRFYSGNEVVEDQWIRIVEFDCQDARSCISPDLSIAHWEYSLHVLSLGASIPFPTFRP